MAIQFQMTQDAEGIRTLTFIGANGTFITVNSQNPGFDETLANITNGDAEAATYSSVPLHSLRDRLRSVNEAFDADGTMVTYEGRRLSERLSNTLLGYARRGDNGINAIANFIERLDENPSAHSVNQLFDWIDSAGLVIDKDGYIVGYKGVTTDTQGNYVSISSGWGFVNGESVTGRLRNNVGDVVSMKRNEVTDDPAIGCHQGLHVGSYEYASTFGPYLLTVQIDPADVVSVPTDCDAQKMRVSRYKVLDVNENKVKFDNYSVYGDDDFDYDYEDDEYLY